MLVQMFTESHCNKVILKKYDMVNCFSGLYLG